MPVQSEAGDSRGSQSTMNGSDASRASILVDGKFEDVPPPSSRLTGAGSRDYQVSHRHRRSRRRQERVDFGWREFVVAFNQFDKVHNGLLPKYTARLEDGLHGAPRADGVSPRTAAENDFLSQQVLRIELQAMNDAWRAMLLAYEQLSMIERESWTDESLCLDILPYVKSFTQFLEWEYKLIRGWTLPSRYRGQLIMDPHPRAYQLAQEQRQATVLVQAQAESYEQEKARGDPMQARQDSAIEAVYADDPARKEPRDEVKGGSGVAGVLKHGDVILSIEEEDGNWQTDDGGEEPNGGISKRTGIKRPPQTLMIQAAPRTEPSMLKATLVQNIATRAAADGSKGVTFPGSHATHHGLSFTREALSQSLLKR